MATRANSSRERILATAEGIILQKGYVGTSLEDILNKAAITKGGFFYHFSGKGELARALVERYLEEDRKLFDSLQQRADSLSEDPLQRLLIFLQLLADAVVGLTEVHPGCLAASFTYEIQQFDADIRESIAAGILAWRAMIAERLELILRQRTPRMPVDVEALADMFTALLEGGIILARIFNSNDPLHKQVLAYRNHLCLLFDALQ
jgi:TetR/AcrR family transcriptional regulator, transcriptional repressor for nem operon